MITATDKTQRKPSAILTIAMSACVILIIGTLCVTYAWPVVVSGKPADPSLGTSLTGLLEKFLFVAAGGGLVGAAGFISKKKEES
jgi:hypothetical protein